MALLREAVAFQHENKSFWSDPDVSWKNNSIIAFAYEASQDLEMNLIMTFLFFSSMLTMHCITFLQSFAFSLTD